MAVPAKNTMSLRAGTHDYSRHGQGPTYQLIRVQTPSKRFFQFAVALEISEADIKTVIYSITHHAPQSQQLTWGFPIFHGRAAVVDVQLSLRAPVKLPRVHVPTEVLTRLVDTPTLLSNSMSRPTIDREALKEKIKVALKPHPQTEASQHTAGKRKAEIVNDGVGKRLKLGHLSTMEGEQMQSVRGATAPKDIDWAELDITAQNRATAGWAGRDTALVTYDHDSNTHEVGIVQAPSHNEHGQTDTAVDDTKQPLTDSLLAKAYKELSEASESMAIWSEAKAAALDAKITAMRAETEASSKLSRAQGRYEQAMARISEATAHRT